MGSVKRFEDLEVRKKSRVFADKVYKLSTIGTFSNDYSLKNQINASSGSIGEAHSQLYFAYTDSLSHKLRSTLYLRTSDIKSIKFS